MKLSVLEYSFEWDVVHGRKSREDVLRAIPSLGIGAVGLSDRYWAEKDPGLLPSILRETGLAISAYGIGTDFALVDRAERRLAVEAAYRTLDRAIELGAESVMVVPGTIKPGMSPDEGRRYLVECLRACVEHVQGADLTLTIEDHDGVGQRRLFGRSADVRAICGGVDSPKFRVTYDGGGFVAVDEDSLSALRNLAPYVAQVHAKSYRLLAPGEAANRRMVADSGKVYTGSRLDEGTPDWQPIFAELRRLGFDGYVTLEYQGEEDPSEAIRKNVEFFRSVLE